MEEYGDCGEYRDRLNVSLGAASALSCSPTERSTEEETPIARAVSRSCAFELSPVGLCVCVCELSQNQPTFIADYGFL